MGTPWYKRYSQVQETDLGRVPEWGAPGTKSAACARLTLVQVNLKPALLPACRFQRGSQPSQIVRIRDGFQDLGKKATSTPCLPTWPALSIFRILGFFSIVPQAAGATGSQATCGDIAGLPKPFHGRLGFPGSQCRDVEPTATVLTAGSTKRSPPHTTTVQLTAAVRMFKPRCWHFYATRWPASGANATGRVSATHQSEALCSFQGIMMNFLMK